MPKYLMLSRFRVLGGQIQCKQPAKNDLVLEEDETHEKHLLANGVLIVNQLNVLVDHYGYKIVFHDEASKEKQLEFLRQLRTACDQKNITFPRVVAMATVDPSLPNTTSANPIKTEVEGILVASYSYSKEDFNNKKPKARVREALLKVLGVKEEECAETIRQSIVFDARDAVVEQARAEGYQAMQINPEDDNNTLHQVLVKVIGVEMQQERKRLEAKVAAQRYDVIYSYGTQDQDKKPLGEPVKGRFYNLGRDDVNLKFLQITEELDELSATKKDYYFNFELQWADVPNGLQAPVEYRKTFDDRHKCGFFLSGRTSLEMPQEVIVGDATPRIIKEVHKQILQMTKQYKQQHEQVEKGESDTQLNIKKKSLKI